MVLHTFCNSSQLIWFLGVYNFYEDNKYGIIVNVQVKKSITAHWLRRLTYIYNSYIPTYCFLKIITNLNEQTTLTFLFRQ